MIQKKSWRDATDREEEGPGGHTIHTKEGPGGHAIDTKEEAGGDTSDTEDQGVNNHTR